MNSADINVPLPEQSQAFQSVSKFCQVSSTEQGFFLQKIGFNLCAGYVLGTWQSQFDGSPASLPGIASAVLALVILVCFGQLMLR